MKFLAFLLLLLTPQAGVPAPQAHPPGRPARVAGTRVSLVPPAGFTPSERFPGYVLEAEGASIIVTEFPFPLAEGLPALSDPEKLKTKAMTLLSKESVLAACAPSVLFGFRQVVSGAEFLKWVLLIGDEAGTVVVTATFPAASEGRLSAPLKRSVLTARRETSLKVSADEGLRYAVAESGVLKRAERLGNSLMFTGGGIFPSPSVDNPLFVVAQSLGGVVTGDRRDFAERRVRQTASVSDVSVVKSEPFTAGGLGGFETFADGKDQASGRPMVIYQAVLFDGRDYYLMQGLISRERSAEHLPSFKEMARSFKRK